MFKVLPYRAGSRSASVLAHGLGGRVLRLVGSAYRPRARDTVINWGNTNPPDVSPARMLNQRGIRDASNKLLFFQNIGGHEPELVPAFWTRRGDIPLDAYPIVCRTVLSGHSGDGIVIASSPDELVPAPLYVKYIKKQDEYRIHVGKKYHAGIPRTDIIDYQQKKRRQDHDEPNYQIRNLANGFIYAREGVEPPVCVLDVACRAFARLDLDFGAVDVIYNAREDRAYVLEVNTAPGITSTTLDSYVEYFRNV